MFRSRKDSTAETHLNLPPVDESEEDTTAFSVATLRDLVAKSAGDPAPLVVPPPPRPRRSVPAFLEKLGAILVMPESGSRLKAAPVAPPPEAPAVAQPEAPAAASVAAAPAADPAPFVTTHIRRTERTHPRAVRAVVPRKRTSVWAFLRFRLFALGLLALVVGSQPWWWNIGDLRGHADAPPLGPSGAPRIHAN
jgi:hypothetical protein